MCLQSKLISGSDSRHYFVDEKVININVESDYLGNELSAYGNMEMLNLTMGKISLHILNYFQTFTC